MSAEQVALILERFWPVMLVGLAIAVLAILAVRSALRRPALPPPSAIRPDVALFKAKPQLTSTPAQRLAASLEEAARVKAAASQPVSPEYRAALNPEPPGPAAGGAARPASPEPSRE